MSTDEGQLEFGIHILTHPLPAVHELFSHLVVCLRRWPGKVLGKFGTPERETVAIYSISCCPADQTKVRDVFVIDEMVGDLLI